MRAGHEEIGTARQLRLAPVSLAFSRMKAGGQPPPCSVNRDPGIYFKEKKESKR